MLQCGIYWLKRKVLNNILGCEVGQYIGDAEFWSKWLGMLVKQVIVTKDRSLDFAFIEAVDLNMN